MEMTDVLTTVNGLPIVVEDICSRLKCNGIFRNTICQLIEEKVVARQMELMRIEVDVTELKNCIDRKRRELGVSDIREMHNYCRWLGIGLDQWEEMVEGEYRKNKLKSLLMDHKKITCFYQENRESFTILSLSRVVSKTQKEALDIHESAVNGRDFSALARAHSVEVNTRSLGGYLGGFKKGMIAEDVWQQSIQAGVEGIVGPFAESGYWTVYRIDAIRNAELNDELCNSIKDRLFREWLNKEVYQARA